MGGNDPFGIDPHTTTRPDVTFDPAYVTVVIVDSPKGWQFTANHASFAIDDPSPANPDPKSPGGRLIQALRILKKAVPGKKPLRDLRPYQTPPSLYEEKKMYRRKDAGTDPAEGYDQTDFQKFGFNSQHEIFVYYTGEAIELDQKNLLSFSKYLTGGATDTADKNDSFFVSAVTLDRTGPLKGRLIRIENYNTIHDEQTGKFTLRSNTDPAQVAVYSMNLHFIVPGKQPIPMIIDPTTGNGNGNNNEP